MAHHKVVQPKPRSPIPCTLRAMQAAQRQMEKMRLGGLSGRSKKYLKAQVYACEVWEAFIKSGKSALLSEILKRLKEPSPPLRNWSSIPS